ncbi:carbamoyltransferase [Alphaproteobacteria bacterium]|nr:carbamoyltransferase [Alphaproteobacteria bacterium]
MTYIIGISCFFHDSAAALIRDGEILHAVQEERFTRKKHDEKFPHASLSYILQIEGLTAKDIAKVVFYEKPLLTFERLLETSLSIVPNGFAQFSKSMPVWLGEKLFLRKLLLEELKTVDAHFCDEQIKFSEHHLSHAASAFFPSPYERATVLCVDGVGEWATTSIWEGVGSHLKLIKSINFPHSIGLLYSAFTQYLGFKVNSGEYKVMGLAPFGKPLYADLIFQKMIKLYCDGSFWIDMQYFDYLGGMSMINQKFVDLFGTPMRTSETGALTEFHINLASSIQEVTERILFHIAKTLAADLGETNLCLAGGVALNCVANGKLLRSGLFRDIWVQPAAGDAGGSIGAALAYYHLALDGPRSLSGSDQMKGAYLGPSFSEAEIEQCLNSVGASYHRLDDDELFEAVAEELSNGSAVGWFQGKMEFGPRALGNRSILADPRNPHVQKELNLKVKFRESFRPFAPSVLLEDAEEWFCFSQDSRYMQFVANVKNVRPSRLDEGDCGNAQIQKRLSGIKSDIPAVTHVDFSARLQTVAQDLNPRFYALIQAFKKKTGVGVVVNTSFNVRGEPIVCSPMDAFKCFMGTDIEVLALENFLLRKSEQEQSLAVSYENHFEMD